MFRFLIVLILLCNISYADDLQGIVKFSEDSARVEAFKDLSRKVSKEIFKDYLKDKYTKENYINIKNKNYYIESEPKRNLSPFYMFNTLAVYSVRYDDDLNKVFYYNVLGHLVKFEINDYDGNYPYRTVAYDRKGNIINTTFTVSHTESFIFDKNANLIGHWFDDKFFDKNGKENSLYKRISE